MNRFPDALIRALFSIDIELLLPWYLTVGFSGSGGVGNTPSPTKTFAGSRRAPASGEAADRLQTVLARF
jgi:hypothetical protein